MTLLLPRDTDIILGVGGIGRYHAGNKWFRRQLEQHKIYYQQIEGRADKRKFLTSILQEIIASGRCFYKKESPNKYCPLSATSQPRRTWEFEWCAEWCAQFRHARCSLSLFIMFMHFSSGGDGK